jgi:hypothetical protein
VTGRVLCGTLALSLSTAFLPPGAAAQPAGPDAPQRASRVAIVAAMQKEVDQGYNLLATTHATRFETSIILRLVRGTLDGPSGATMLLLDHTDWYEAYRQVTGLEPEQVPEFIALAHEYGQDRVVDFDPARNQIERKEGIFEPELIVRVSVGWPEEPGAADRYTFVDTTTSPNLRVTNRRRISYWLVDLGKIVLQDEIEGVQARPLGGALGTLFSIVGDGSAVQNRLAIAEDGLVVTYATAKKGPFKVRPLTLTYPDGTVDTEFPPERLDLLQIKYEIKMPLKFEYPDRD